MVLLFIYTNFALKTEGDTMKNFVLVFAVMFLNVTTALGQKEYRQIRASLKANNGDAALADVQKYEKTEEFKDDPELYHYGFEAYVKKNNTLNEQAYLKQLKDTAGLFNSVYGIFEYAIRCDSFDSKPNDKGKVKIRYRKDHESMLRRLYPNLNNGGLFFVSKSQFPDAYKFLSMYINVPQQPVFNKKLSDKDSLNIIRAAYWATVCAYQMKDSAKFFTYYPLAVKDSTYRAKEMELAAEMYALAGDVESRVKCLHKGVKEFPTNYYFFANLLDYYNEQGQYDKALALSDSMLSDDPRSVISLYGKSLVFLKMKRYDDCITVSKSLLQNDSTYTDVYYNIGASYYAKAIEYDNKVTADMGMTEMRNIKREVDKLYRTALPYLEQYRAMAADKIDRWGRPLYRIYLSLNMGDKFDEIDKLLLQNDAQKAAEAQKAEGEKK